MKKCNRCKIEKSLNNFGMRQKGKYVSPYCKPCTTQMTQEYNKRTGYIGKSGQPKDPDYNKKYYLRNKHRRKRPTPLQTFTKKLKDKYGITYDFYLKELEKTNNKCTICSNIYEKLVVDHCHKTGKYRGLICLKCNTGLGMFVDNINTLKSAIDYLINKGYNEEGD